MLKKTLLLAASAVLLVSVSSCAASTESAVTTSAGDKKITVGYSGAIQSNPNNKAIEDGIRAKADSLGMDLIVTDAQYNTSKQLADIQSLLNRNVDVLIVWPIDPLGIQPAIEQADSQGVPVIVQDTTDGGPYTSNFQVTNYASAQQAATFIGENVEATAKVVQIEGVPTVGVLDARNKGFQDGAKETGLNILASEVNGLDTADGARPIVDAWKSRFGTDIQAIFAYNDDSALGAASAKAGDFNPMVIGMNGSQEGIDGVKDGRLAATFDFHPVQLGMGLGWAAHELAEGRSIPKTVVMESTLITAANASSWIPIKALLGSQTSVDITTKDGVSTLNVTASK
ncbi:sugar ABC transporter substrate-binding protein [Cryobacterium sp. PH29-G1]|uniref:sugar ABC transporter substrate-binding protein n=1 Tax=Cryobacterium sp. PH29-G1 TaxID=3046211 RepID=UPI0024B8D53A|nr:sugar ABC transporter substrate-binding protein [Cryobacterium sp. PH29-G1]MDJ0349590.1 sugar ABC transporter substrate-binding protein [Cryobacterium sp. PH29-G1]